MKPELRRERIVDRVRERERVSVEELAEWLGSSRETIRRDLTTLADLGRVRKYHGGATLAEVRREDRFAQRLVDAVHEKRAVAVAAAALFPRGSTIFVDVGTTTLMFADALAGREDLTVITNGIDIARKLAFSGVKVFIVGGEFNPETAESVGTLALEQIGRFYASDAVITVAGLNASGAMDFQLDEAQIARAMIAQARVLTVIADGSKLGRDALFQVCPLEAVDRLVVDRAPDAPLAEALATAGVKVILADPLIKLPP
jgi:DeoR family glycerol-3-phosphate regulon repressor